MFVDNLFVVCSYWGWRYRMNTLRKFRDVGSQQVRHYCGACPPRHGGAARTARHHLRRLRGSTRRRLRLEPGLPGDVHVDGRSRGQARRRRGQTPRWDSCSRRCPSARRREARAAVKLGRGLVKFSVDIAEKEDFDAVDRIASKMYEVSVTHGFHEGEVVGPEAGTVERVAIFIANLHGECCGTLGGNPQGTSF